MDCVVTERIEQSALENLFACNKRDEEAFVLQMKRRHRHEEDDQFSRWNNGYIRLPKIEEGRKRLVQQKVNDEQPSRKKPACKPLLNQNQEVSKSDNSRNEIVSKMDSNISRLWSQANACVPSHVKQYKKTKSSR